MTYIYTQLCTMENLAGLGGIAVIYVICMVFAIRCSRKRAAELDAEEE